MGIGQRARDDLPVVPGALGQAAVFQTSWNTVYRAVTLAVVWGIAQRSLEGVTAIGVDEIQWRQGHQYLTLVYQIQEGCKRLLYVTAERTEESLRGFFQSLGQARSAALRFAFRDMWKPYLKVIAACAGEAVHVPDRYHVMAGMSKAIDEVRAEEAKRLKAAGHDPVLKHSRWVLLKRPENLTENQMTPELSKPGAAAAGERPIVYAPGLDRTGSSSASLRTHR